MEGLLEQHSQLADLGVARCPRLQAVWRRFFVSVRRCSLPGGFRTLCATLYPAAQIDQQHLHRDQACRRYVVARGELRFLVQHEALPLSGLSSPFARRK